MKKTTSKDVLYYSKCSCGAITLHMSDNKTSYSCKKDNLKVFLPSLDLTTIERLQDSYCCDHCVNHYGLDLCGCGSGEPFGECDNELSECQYPMQEFETYDRIVSVNSWTRR